MKRTTKRVLAAFIAALMAVYCLPMTALAGQNDYGQQHPNVYATYYSGAFDVYKATGASSTGVKLSDDSIGPLMSAPQTLDDIAQLSAGDAFAVTFWLNGMDTLQSLQAIIQYDSTQVQPLHVLGEKVGTKYNCKLASRDEAKASVAANSSNKDVDVCQDPTYNADALYEGAPGSEYTFIDDPNYVAGNDILLGITNVDQTFALPYGTTVMEDYASLEAGTDGTAYDDILLITLNFYVVKDNPTNFWNVWTGLDSSGNDSTFAKSWLNQDNYTVSKEDSHHPEFVGSGLMTVLGFGDNAPQEPTTKDYTVTYKDATGGTISTETVTEGNTPASVPDLPAMTHDADTHTTYAWDVTPGAAITGDTTYTQVATSVAHTWDAGTVTTAATHSQAGEMTYTCTVCGQTKTESIAQVPHTPATTPVSNNNGTHSYLCTEDNAVCSTENCTYASAVTAPTCTAQGYTTYTCSKCGYSYVSDYTVPTGHDYGDWMHTEGTANASSTHSRSCIYGDDTQTENCTFTSEVTQAATATLPEITTYTCSACGYQYTAETASPLGHTHVLGDKTANYTSGQAYDAGATYTHSQTCTGEGTCSYPDNKLTANCTFDAGTVTKAATCGATGTMTYTCTECGGTYTQVIPATGDHTYGTWHLTDGTSQATATHSKVCSVCGDTVTEACNFTGTVIQNATYTQPELTQYTCSDCGYMYIATTAPALVDNRVTVTVGASDMGTVMLDTTDATLGTSAKYEVGDAFTLTATPNDGCEFVGWQQGNKIVSTNTTLTATAYVDATYTPVFIEAAAAELTFIYVDMYGNVIDTITTADASTVKAPTAPVVFGYTFTGWSADATQATESATIYAQYDKDVVTTYTVTATGCSITDGTNTANDTLAVPYETQVTVSKAGTTAWEVNGVKVAYGDSYTFYVGNNITVTPVTEAVVAAPTVAIVSANQVAGSYKVQFVASRSITDGYTFIQAGYVYGKDMAQDDLTLANVGQKGSNATSGNVKVAYSSGTSGDAQFTLSYGVSAMNAPACARAFITVKDADGTVSTIYSDMSAYTYGG